MLDNGHTNIYRIVINSCLFFSFSKLFYPITSLSLIPHTPSASSPAQPYPSHLLIPLSMICHSLSLSKKAASVSMFSESTHQEKIIKRRGEKSTNQSFLIPSIEERENGSFHIKKTKGNK